MSVKSPFPHIILWPVVIQNPTGILKIVFSPKSHLKITTVNIQLNSPIVVGKDIRVGPTYIQAYTSCNIEYAIPTEKVMEDAKTVEDDRYKFTEYVSEEAKQFLTERYGYKEFRAKPAAATAIPNKV